MSKVVLLYSGERNCGVNIFNRIMKQEMTRYEKYRNSTFLLALNTLVLSLLFGAGALIGKRWLVGAGFLLSGVQSWLLMKLVVLVQKMGDHLEEHKSTEDDGR